MAFSTLQLSAPLLQALKEEGYTVPTPIQAQAIPPILEGRDLLGCAQTGTGKTAAFALPILHRLLSMPVDKTQRGPHRPRALILAPTRELCNQIAESFATYGRHTGLQLTAVFGGVSQFHQVKALRRGVDILVATPGRLMDLMEQRHADLSAISVFVLDEADRMLDMGFIQPIRRIASALPKPDAAHPCQTLLFSATMPKEIMHLADSLLTKPVKVSVAPVGATVPLIEQKVYMIERPRKQALLHHILADETTKRVVVFTRTKHGADKVARRLKQAGISSDAIHGNKAQNARTRALEAFRAGRARVLVATDVAARGLDVDGITHVINFDLPNEPEAYIHRIGRTGRAGATGIAISFCDGEERGFLRDIERLTGKRVPAAPKLPDLPSLPPDAAPTPYETSYSPPAGRSGGYGSRDNNRGRGRPGPRFNDQPRSPKPEHAHAGAEAPVADTGPHAAHGHARPTGPRASHAAAHGAPHGASHAHNAGPKASSHGGSHHPKAGGPSKAGGPGKPPWAQAGKGKRRGGFR